MTGILTILLNYNGKRDTLACLDSLKKAGKRDRDVVVVDNGSSDGSVEAISSAFPLLALLETGQNIGYSAGNNRGIEWGMQRDFKTFLLLNNDTVVAPDLFEAFQQALHEHPATGIFGAKIYLQSDPSRLDHFGGNWNSQKGEMDFVGRGVVDGGKEFEAPFAIDYACGAALLVRREVFEKIGLLDPRYFLYWEDTDFCFSARRAGFGVQIAPKAKVWHKVSASTGKQGKPFACYFCCRNHLLWLEKQLPWGQKVVAYCKVVRDLGQTVPKFCYRTLRARLFPQMKNREGRLRQLLMQKAHIWGVRDYFLRRFGAGSSALFKNKQTP